jgi:hypothetical protein
MIIKGIATNPKTKKDNKEPIKNKICILYFAQVNSLIFNENKGISAFKTYELKIVINNNT